MVQGVSEVGAPLLAGYDLDAVRATVTPEVLKARPHDLWRHREVLPVRDPAHITTLGRRRRRCSRSRRTSIAVDDEDILREVTALAAAEGT